MFNEILTRFIFYIYKLMIIKQKLGLENHSLPRTSSAVIFLLICREKFYWYNESAAEKIFFENSLRKYLACYMCEPCRTIHFETPWCMFLGILFLDCHRFFQRFPIVWGVVWYASAYVYIIVAKSHVDTG